MSPRGSGRRPNYGSIAATLSDSANQTGLLHPTQVLIGTGFSNGNACDLESGPQLSEGELDRQRSNQLQRYFASPAFRPGHPWQRAKPLLTSSLAHLLMKCRMVCRTKPLDIQWFRIVVVVRLDARFPADHARPSNEATRHDRIVDCAYARRWQDCNDSSPLWRRDVQTVAIVGISIPTFLATKRRSSGANLPLSTTRFRTEPTVAWFPQRHDRGTERHTARFTNAFLAAATATSDNGEMHD